MLVIRWVAPAVDGPATVLGPGVTVLGRDPECAGCLPSTEISRKHAEVRWVGGVPMLRDLDSTNGVFVNQRRVTQAPLRSRDVLRLGDWVGVLALAPRADPAAWAFEEIIPGYWAGPALLAALAPARRVAASDLPIVIEGETGAGKEGAARAVHGWSGRAGRFVGLNCAALPETLAEAELFGYRKGAFTGADRTQPRPPARRRRRNAAPRRDRRPAAAGAGEVAARDRGARGAAAGRERPGPRRRAPAGRNPAPAATRGGREALPRRSVRAAGRLSPGHPAAARARRGDSVPVPAAAREARRRGATAAARTAAGRAAVRLRVAVQRPRADAAGAAPGGAAPERRAAGIRDVGCSRPSREPRSCRPARTAPP